MNVEGIAAVFWDQAVDERHLCTKGDQSPGQRRADEPESAGYQNVGSEKRRR